MSARHLPGGSAGSSSRNDADSRERSDGAPVRDVPEAAPRAGASAGCRDMTATSGAASTLRAPAATKTGTKPYRSAAHSPAGRISTCGSPTARPYRPTARPRRPGATRPATSAAPATVTMPNPAPRTADTASTHGSAAEAA
nr:hypothetical protein GCM10010200_076430 [Actinomadura rugatobispora]